MEDLKISRIMACKTDPLNFLQQREETSRERILAWETKYRSHLCLRRKLLLGRLTKN